MFAEASELITSLKIIFMRHGEATGSPDIERRLTNRGKSQSRSVANTLSSLDITPDIVICSTLGRARQTLTEMNLHPDIPVLFCGEDLYRAESHRTILNIVAEIAPHDKQCVLVIGHNPAIHETVLYLSNESRGDKFKNLEQSYPSGTASVFEVKADSWDMIHPATCSLTHVISAL